MVVVLLLGAVSAAHGAAILLSDDRQLSASVTVDVDTVTAAAFPPSPFAPWTELVVASDSVDGSTAVAQAFQDSTITPSLFSFELAGTLNTGRVNVGAALSQFRVGFELTTPHSFVLAGFFDELFFGGFDFSFTFLSFGSVVVAGTIGDILVTGVLAPGIYDFLAFVAPESVPIRLDDRLAFGEFDFALTELAQVPEPSAWLLLGAAVAGAAWSGRRKVRSGAA